MSRRMYGVMLSSDKIKELLGLSSEYEIYDIVRSSPDVFKFYIEHPDFEKTTELAEPYFLRLEDILEQEENE